MHGKKKIWLKRKERKKADRFDISNGIPLKHPERRMPAPVENAYMTV